ncbi:MAG: lysostaphin resistance A-like protein [Actinomycetota bacterium]
MRDGRGRGILRRHGPETAPPRPTGTWRDAVEVLVLAYAIGYLVRILLFGDRRSPTAHVMQRMVAELTWLVVVAVWLRIRGARWATAFGRPARAWPEVRDGAVFGAILYGTVALAVALPAAWILRLVTDRDVEARVPLPEGLPPIGWAVAVVLALLVAPIAEEVLFRGVLVPAVRQRFGVAVAVAGSSLVFGLAHVTRGDPLQVTVEVAVATAMGVGLAIQYARRGNLVAPVAAHLAFNVLGLLILLRR